MAICTVVTVQPNLRSVIKVVEPQACLYDVIYAPILNIKHETFVLFYQ